MLKTREFGEQDEDALRARSEHLAKDESRGPVGRSGFHPDLSSQQTSQVVPTRTSSGSGIFIGAANDSCGGKVEDDAELVENRPVVGSGQCIPMTDVDAGGAAAKTIATQHLLVVDDDDGVRSACLEIARRMGFHVHEAESVPSARGVLKQLPIDLLLLDLKMPGGGGLSLLEETKALHPEMSVVVMTAFATVASAVEAMQIGASEYLTKPFALEELTTMLGRASQRRRIDLESRLLREKLRSQKGDGFIIGNSPEM
jgi:ActR/RegA family two-component response regulator